MKESDKPLEILTAQQRSKIDETNDLDFYAYPKFVYHLDKNFRDQLKLLYEREISNNSTILDLMSSWDSYLPEKLQYKKVIGHGLNEAELKRNKSIEFFWIQNFNTNQNIPLEESSVDYCLIVAGWQYLQFPEKIAQEISRILSHSGKLIISFSNRAFWTKAPNIWTNSSEEGRVNYVKSILISNGFNEPKIVRKYTSHSNSFLPFFNRDPFYSIIAEKSSK